MTTARILLAMLLDIVRPRRRQRARSAWWDE